MHDNQIRDEGLAKHQSYMLTAAGWRRAQPVPATTQPATSAARQLQMIWATVVNLLIGH